MKEITLKKGNEIQINLPNGSRVTIKSTIWDLGSETLSNDTIRVSHFDKEEYKDKLKLNKFERNSSNLGNSYDFKWQTGELSFTEKVENEESVGRTVKETEVMQTVFYKR